MVDVHIHGAGGHSAMDGPDAIRAMARYLAPRGITAFVPTGVSAPIEDLARFARDVGVVRVAQDAERAAGELREAAVLGGNLEGPALAPSHKGAHDPAALRPPAELLAAFEADPQAWAEVRIVTVAPEQPGGMELVRRLADDGRVASIGHTGATYEQAWAAYEAGARSSTHLFNQMTPLMHRAPGTVTAALTHPAATVELIADGVHVHSAVWPVVWRTAGERLMLVSDSVPPTGMGDGEVTLGGLRVRIEGGRATLADGTLAGSTTLLDGALRNVLAAGLDLPTASSATSTRAASLVGAAQKGRIEAGADADLLLVGPTGTIERVMLGGRWLDER
jgi:N-acetylglucosamine-6-phosphate deacetylase